VPETVRKIEWPFACITERFHEAVLSLRHFRLEICWSLSLGGWWPLSPARRLRRRAAARPARAADPF
jgi:hypothetical protein